MNPLDLVAAVLLLLCIAAPLVEEALTQWEAQYLLAETLRTIEEHAPPIHPMCRCIIIAEPIDAPACNVIVLAEWKRRHPVHRRRH